jgi:PHD/YefM family antitoxin component YafN of YafNO toxin-antitoxin module
MHSVQQTELTPQLRRLVQHTIASHEPLRLSIGNGQSVVLLPEQDYQQLIGMLNQVQQVMPSRQPGAAKGRVFGSARGMIRIADDFDAPLDDFRDYM